MVVSAWSSRKAECMARRMLADCDDDPLFAKSTLRQRDALSRISEGSSEAGSVTSTYFSVGSGAKNSLGSGSGNQPSGGREFLTAAGAIRLSVPQADRGSGAYTSAKLAVTTASSGSASSAVKAQVAEPQSEDLRKTVRAFVEAGVRGRRLEVLRRDGQIQTVIFSLSRQVDSFEISLESGRSSHVVRLENISSVYTGDDVRASGELHDALPGLDESCAVIDLNDGRSLAFRFLEADARREAVVFGRCMQLFASEVSREQSESGSSKPSLESGLEKMS
eukprot:TRINITY_DN33913_c0_g1_i1.p1 TRINITY_DN33913_c0_g1~~TRINITY_DN33913_c0_g1_i1.p1  ORF type:complete len:278 (+),score=42.72 TRINITY_DN33913_c0_g1_i1:86-919(+)